LSKKEDVFLNIKVDQDLMDRIDDFRFLRRFDTRAQAVRFLLNYALDKCPDPKEE